MSGWVKVGLVEIERFERPLNAGETSKFSTKNDIISFYRNYFKTGAVASRRRFLAQDRWATLARRLRSLALRTDAERQRIAIP